MKKIVLMTMAAFMLTACTKELIGYHPEETPTEVEDPNTEANIAKSFDYKLTQEVPVVLNYSRKGVLVEIKDANERDAELAMKGVQPRVLYAAYTGNDGHYEGKMTIPSSYIGKTVYATTRTMGALSNIPVTVTKDGLVVNEAAATRGIAQGNRAVPEQLLTDLDAQLKEERNNSDKLSEKTNDISIKVNKDVDYIDVTFIYGGAGVWYSGHFEDNIDCRRGFNQWLPFDTSCDLYYFLYTDDNVPSKDYINTYYINDQHKVVAHVNNGNSGIYGKDPNVVGTTVRITLEDGITTKIPAGTRIGWVVTHPYYTYVDGWDASLSGYTVPYLYSINEYNPGGHSQSIRYQWGQGDDKEIIYGMEDAPLENGIKLWGETWEQHQEHIAAGTRTDDHYYWAASDRDYNDVMFVVKASNPDAIIEDEIPVLPPAPVVYSEESTEGTLLFEDLYPEQGDYDMNDVVITYKLTKYFDSDNKLAKLGYEFTPVWSGADYNSAFSFMLDGWTDAIRIFDDQTKYVNCYAATDKLTTFSGEITTGAFIGKNKDELTWDAFNPFITVKQSGYEVHLTKKAASANAKLDGLNAYQKAYVNEGNFPFAMNIPTTDYIITTEKTRIDIEYPHFIEWVKTNGLYSADWYQHPAE